MDDRAIQSLKGPVFEFLKCCELKGPDFKIREQKEPAGEALRLKLKKAFGDVADPWLLQREIEEEFKCRIEAAIDIVPENKPAKEVLTDDVLERQAHFILDWLSTIPRAYSFYIPLSSVLACSRGTIAVFEDFGFFEPAQYFDYENKSYSDPRSPNDVYPRVFDLASDTPVEGVYLRVDGHGYFAMGMGFGAIANAMSRVKQLLFLTYVTDKAFRESDDIQPQVQNMTGFVVDHEYDMGRAVPFTLPPTIQRGAKVWNIYPWWADSEMDEKQPTVAELRDTWTREWATIYYLMSNSEQFESLLTACEWAFDSRYEANETVSYIFLAIAFESLLGSNAGESNISGSLAKSLALIVAESHRERDKIYNDFKRFYQIRSKISHGKRSCLESSERKLRVWGMEMFHRALKKEIALIGSPKD